MLQTANPHKRKSVARRGQKIRVTGAREHNLKNISLDLPRDSLIVITGLSGSGKSSLAFDTIYAEGRRRYVESLSAYARQFLQGSAKPDVDQIEGLSPAISIEQKTSSRNPRSTVGTVTEIYDYMRLLFARAGIAYSPATGKPIERQTVTEMVDKVIALPAGKRLLLMAPVVRARKGEYRREFAEYLKKGFQRVRVDGEVYDLGSPPALKKNIRHDISVIVDRIITGNDIAERLADSFETALKLAGGLAEIEEAPPAGKNGKKQKPIKMIFSEQFACPVSGFTIEEIEPRLFSFNSPHGACPACGGLGTESYADPQLVVPDKSLSLSNGAIAPWARTGVTSPYYSLTLHSLAKHYKFSMDAPWRSLPKKAKDLILYGTKGEAVKFSYRSEKMHFETKRPFEGVLRNLDRRYQETGSGHTREILTSYLSQAACSACNGARLRPEALCVKIGEKNIGEIGLMSVREAHGWFSELPARLSPRQKAIAERVLREIRERLRFLCDVGLDYLTLARSAHTLSGGESQRIRLASQIGSGLTGVVYVLDEPSIGLHPRDNNRLLNSLSALSSLNNTVIVVEHDEEAIKSADHVVDIGPGAGIHGGKVVAEGTPAQIMRARKSLTGQYLSGKKIVPMPKTSRPPPKRWLTISGAKGNNLHNVRAEIPLGYFTCITGLSGSGKSTLLLDTIYRALARHFSGSGQPPLPHGGITGLEHLDKIIEIDQSPIGRTPRSNPATYTGAFTPIREWFAGLPASRERGYKPGRFSFNVKGGRCEACEGDGVLRIEMHFLPDVYVECDACKGKRYNRETLQVLFRGHSIADVLDMSVEEAANLFKAVPAIYNHLELLHRVGLDYIRVGQQATTLSGGEAQRIKLAKELSRRATGRTIYILDEPTTGLHFHDVAKLLEVLHALVDTGNSVVVIEHNMEVVKTADWVIDLGPEGGERGGQIIATGAPQTIAHTKASATAKFLAEALARHK